MAQKVKFKRKTTEEIEDLEIEDGSLIYNVENGKTYMDYGNNRIPTGGAGGEVVLDENDITEDTKIIVESEDLDFRGSEITNSYSESTEVGYSANYTNNLVKDVYSTSEVKTNKVWIDGKPIYRKCWTGSMGTATEKAVDTISNYGECTGYFLKLVTATGVNWMGYLTSSVASGLQISGQGAIRIFRLGTDNMSYKLVIEYTKSTD